MCGMEELRVLSVYEGFFSGGARILHSGVVAAHHGGRRQHHTVQSIQQEVHRESVHQSMFRDASYRLLRAAGLPVSTLGRRMGRLGTPADSRAADARRSFTPEELEHAAQHLAQVDVVLSLKEQPLDLVTAPGLPRRPIVVCLHRSDPMNQGPALADLKSAIAADRIASVVCCAESTRTAYAAAGIPEELLHVIPNGSDRRRFRPAGPLTRRRLRHALGVPPGAGLVVFAGRHDPMKNVPLFLRTAREFLLRDATGEVVMCGAGMDDVNPVLAEQVHAVFGDDEHLLARLNRLGIRRDMENVYRAADVVALTSTFGEAAPLCLIEGMLSGAVPVTTDVGDSAAIVDGRGLVTQPDPVAISEAWTEALSRREEFLAATAASAERFSHRRMVRAYAEVISRTPRTVRVSGRALALA
jgi:glycosyltransferase involved in cell wall biosynthesis